MVLINADIRLNDGTILPAVLQIDEQSSGEHWGTFFLLDDKIVSQSSKNIFTALGKTKDQIFPYSYRYYVDLKCDDIHAKKGEWSF
jgi:hypothetical protein